MNRVTILFLLTSLVFCACEHPKVHPYSSTQSSVDDLTVTSEKLLTPGVYIPKYLRLHALVFAEEISELLRSDEARTHYSAVFLKLPDETSSLFRSPDTGVGPRIEFGVHNRDYAPGGLPTDRVTGKPAIIFWVEQTSLVGEYVHVVMGWEAGPLAGGTILYRVKPEGDKLRIVDKNELTIE